MPKTDPTPVRAAPAKSLPASQKIERIARFAAARFEKSVVEYEGCPPESGEEIAFVGRSNAGKSSTINRFVGQTRLAYASKLPGRTRELNFFTLRGGGYLVDLPGYGFAKTPRDKQRVWIGVIEEYLRLRSVLGSIVIVSDIRHAPHALDLEFIDWINQLPTDARPRPRILWLLNKADKLTQSERMRAENTLRREASDYLTDADSVVLFSASTGLGMKFCDAFFGASVPAPDLPQTL